MSKLVFLSKIWLSEFLMNFCICKRNLGEKMLFGKHWLDQTIDEYFGEIGSVAENPATLVFLDTNILAYLFKLHAGARSEFFQWLDGIVAAGRLAVPAWAANEYLSRVTSKTLSEFTPKSKEPSQVLKALEAMHETGPHYLLMSHC